jgi:hypothetical protein
MLFIIYTGEPSDPYSQRMKLVRAPTFVEAKAKYPEAIAIQVYVRPVLQPEPNLSALKKGMPVWSF